MSGELSLIPAELVRQSTDIASLRFQAARLILTRCVPNPETNCWEFTGHRDKLGYGKLKFAGSGWLTHRLSYFATYGEIPDGLLLCHRCDNPSCANPHHLFLGTNLDNTMDAVRKGRKYIPDRKGEQHSQAKLKESEVRAIRELSGKISQKRIGIRFGINQATVCNIITGKTWRNVK